MSMVGSALWPKPSACPSSWAITLRVTLGSVSEVRRSLRMPMMTLPPQGGRAVKDTKFPSDNTMVTSPGSLWRLSGISRGLTRLNTCALSLCSVSARTSAVVCTTGPNLNGVPSSANVRFQKLRASCAACSRASSSRATKTMVGTFVHALSHAITWAGTLRSRLPNWRCGTRPWSSVCRSRWANSNASGA